ncbi:helitron_like_N domain-containing protein [Trichonephila clavipes]|nr:helitron_like_N domain-containing protein [Trichonephila clavipes]
MTILGSNFRLSLSTPTLPQNLKNPVGLDNILCYGMRNNVGYCRTELISDQHNSMMFMARNYLSSNNILRRASSIRTQRAGDSVHMMATSEIRRELIDAVQLPDHVLYMAMKMLRIRVVEVDTELHSILYDSQKDLFAMLRQLGKPTVFFTISANEIKWPKLLKILHGLSDSFKDIHAEDP